LCDRKGIRPVDIYPVGQKNCTLFIFSTARVKPHSMSILFGIQIPE